MKNLKKIVTYEVYSTNGGSSWWNVGKFTNRSDAEKVIECLESVEHVIETKFKIEESYEYVQVLKTKNYSDNIREGSGQ